MSLPSVTDGWRWEARPDHCVLLLFTYMSTTGFCQRQNWARWTSGLTQSMCSYTDMCKLVFLPQLLSSMEKLTICFKRTNKLKHARYITVLQFLA